MSRIYPSGAQKRQRKEKVKSMQGSMDRFLIKPANPKESGITDDEFEDPMEDENGNNAENVNEEDKEADIEHDGNLGEKGNEDVNDQENREKSRILDIYDPGN